MQVTQTTLFPAALDTFTRVLFWHKLRNSIHFRGKIQHSRQAHAAGMSVRSPLKGSLRRSKQKQVLRGDGKRALTDCSERCHYSNATKELVPILNSSNWIKDQTCRRVAKAQLARYSCGKLPKMADFVQQLIAAFQMEIQPWYFKKALPAHFLSWFNFIRSVGTSFCTHAMHFSRRSMRRRENFEYALFEAVCCVVSVGFRWQHNYVLVAFVLKSQYVWKQRRL